MRWIAVAVALVAATAHAKPPEVTVVAFGSAHCKPCRAERPMLDTLAKKYAADEAVRIEHVSVDDDAGARAYARIFATEYLAVPRLAVVDRDGVGLQRQGARTGETRAEFVRELSAAIESVRAHAPAPPTPMWTSLSLR